MELKVQTPGKTPVEPKEIVKKPAPKRKAPAKPARKPAEKAEGGETEAPAKRSSYLDTHSSEVDASKLTKPVLCSDGWLVPNTLPSGR